MEGRGYIWGVGRLSAGGSIRERQCSVLVPGPFPTILPHVAQPCPAFSPTCPQQSHIGEALPLEMVTRLYDGMRKVDLMGKAKGPSESVSREQFTMSMSHLLKGNSEEKSLMILKMISATEGPVKAREIQKVEWPRGPLQPCHAALVCWGRWEAASGGAWRCPLGVPRPLVRSGLLDRGLGEIELEHPPK